MRLLRLLAASLCLPLAHSFTPQTPTRSVRHPSPSSLRASFEEDPEDAKVIEEVRLNVLNSRRNMIRWTLRNAESVRNLRLQNGWVPELDENGKPIKSDGKTAVTLTAAVVARPAIAPVWARHQPEKTPQRFSKSESV